MQLEVMKIHKKYFMTVLVIFLKKMLSNGFYGQTL